MDSFVVSVVCYWLAASLAIVVLVTLVRMARGSIQDTDRTFCFILAGMLVLALLFSAAGWAVSSKGRFFGSTPVVPTLRRA
ncbi:hypothetical protein ABLE91_22720 [Aquabacter sp. CN5-332]|uniref:hypothetical protein n=1 Tax=Aquabacter sp. CN5-332 TaxID=3156608 RepID=UPI0032B601B7